MPQDIMSANNLQCRRTAITARGAQGSAAGEHYCIAASGIRGAGGTEDGS